MAQAKTPFTAGFYLDRPSDYQSDGLNNTNLAVVARSYLAWGLRLVVDPASHRCQPRISYIYILDIESASLRLMRTSFSASSQACLL
jgi:hypothetical protein